jgi:hypothetical protein
MIDRESRVEGTTVNNVELRIISDRLGSVSTIPVIETLVRYGMQLPLAQAVIEAMLRDASHPVTVHLPLLDDAMDFAHEMGKSGVRVVFLVRKYL